jgi:transposase InsO family protein
MDNEEKKRLMALFKYSIIGPILNNTTGYKTIKEYCQSLISSDIRDPFGRTAHISYSSISHWLHNYRVYGFDDGLVPRRRADKGAFRKCPDNLKDEVVNILKDKPRVSSIIIYETLITNNVIQRTNVSLRTISRLMNVIKAEKKQSPTKEYRRYEVSSINEVWHGDSSSGPWLHIDKKKYPLHIIALIDDASRLIVGCRIVFNDNVENLFVVIKEAVSKYGIPQKFVFDNGSNYKSEQTNLLIARLGTTLKYCPPRTPTSKAKIERWFKTLKEQWLANISFRDFKSIEEYQKSLDEYVNQYNHRVHSSLENTSPFNRFFAEPEKIRRKENDKLDDDFLFTIQRKSTIDGIIRIKNMEFEAPIEYAKRLLTIRYSGDFQEVYVENNKNLIKITKLNKKDNAISKRRYSFKIEEEEKNE